MIVAQLERLGEHLQRLRLFKYREQLEAPLQDAVSSERSFADFLDNLLCEEVAAKTARNVTMRTNLTRFPVVKSLEAFDFVYQPSIDRKQLTPGATGRGSGSQSVVAHGRSPASGEAYAR